MPDTLTCPPTPADRRTAARLVRQLAAGHAPRASLTQPLPATARLAAETLATTLDELERELAQLRHRHGETPGVGAEIRLATEQAALLGAYERDVTEALAALRRAGAAVAVEVPDYLVPPTATGPATLRLRW